MGVGGRMTSGFGGLRFVAWGPGSFLAIVPDIPPEIWITGARTDEKWKWREITMPKGVWIEWMDW